MVQKVECGKCKREGRRTLREGRGGHRSREELDKRVLTEVEEGRVRSQGTQRVVLSYLGLTRRDDLGSGGRRVRSRQGNYRVHRVRIG